MFKRAKSAKLSSIGACALLSASTLALSGLFENVPIASAAPTVSQPPWYQAPTQSQLHEAKRPTVAGLILSSGPFGEKAFPASDIHITSRQLAKIRSGHFTAAIAVHYSSDWTTSQIQGVESEFKKLGIKVVAVTNANFKDSEQISDLQAIAAKKPNILISIPVNAQTEASAYQKIAQQGTHIVFMDQPANGMTAGKDYKSGKNYVSVVSADNFGNGMVAADELAKALHRKGSTVALYYAPNFYVTNQRYEGFVARLEAKYPNIHLLAAQGFNDPNNTTSVANALLTKYPSAQSAWVAWSDPAMGAIAAARSLGKSPSNFSIVTEDLSNDTALNMAQKSFVKGLGAQRPEAQGIAEAEEAALSMIGAKTHAYVAVPSLAVDRANLIKSYQTVYQMNPPKDIMQALQ